MRKAKSPINEALENIFLKNILLKSIRAENHHFDVELNPDIKYKVLLKHKVIQSSLLESTDHSQHLLRVSLSYGVKWVAEEDASKELAIIEADYMAEYKLKKVISDEAVDAFCLKNTGHNVWPYWRELVSTTTQRLGLPNLTLPLQKTVKER